MKGLTLDAGALIGIERNARNAIAIVRTAVASRIPMVVPAGVVGQVWRDGQRQVRLVRLLASVGVEVEPLDDQRARAAGQLCGRTGTRDVIDASVVLCARARKHKIVTSDPEDLRRLDASVDLIVI